MIKFCNIIDEVVDVENRSSSIPLQKVVEKRSFVALSGYNYDASNGKGHVNDGNHRTGLRLYPSEDSRNMTGHNNSNNNSIALKVQNVSKIFESPAGRFVALKRINFTIKKGEFVSIVGPSGSGKSTLLNIIGALDRPSYGKVFIDGVDISSLGDRQVAKIRNTLIGYIFQSFNLINRTSVLKNVEIPSIISGMDSQARHKRALKILQLLGIKDKAGYKPANLSGGQQQRVAIARSLMNNPAMILADEPTGNLDTKTGHEVFDLLKMLKNKYKRTIVFVTHNPALAKETDRIIHIKDGMVEKEEIVDAKEEEYG